MVAEDLEHRVRDIEFRQDLNKQKRSRFKDRRLQRKERKKLSRRRRSSYYIIGRVVSLAVAYIALTVFLWALEEPKPWLRALAPVIVVSIYLIVTPYVQKLLFNRALQKDEEDEELSDGQH